MRTLLNLCVLCFALLYFGLLSFPLTSPPVLSLHGIVVVVERLKKYCSGVWFSCKNQAC